MQPEAMSTDDQIRDTGTTLSAEQDDGQEWEELMSAAEFSAANASSWQVSYSGEYVLFATDSHALYRHSRISHYTVFDLAVTHHNRAHLSLWDIVPAHCP